MEYISEVKNINVEGLTLYPQARYPEARVSTYSNTNDCNFDKNNIYNRSILNKSYEIDPITRQISNNITNNYNQRIEKSNKLNESLEIIKDSINDELMDENLYNLMASQAIQDEDKKILQDIASDEKKHNLMLKQIYYSLTGSNINHTKSMEDIKNNTYFKNLKNSLFGEINAAKKYRKVLSTMPDKENYNKLMEIMTDELTHADKFNYLISKYLVNKEETKTVNRE